MAKLDDLEKQNQWLFDMLFRHQVYLEGYKEGMSAGYRQLLDKLYGEFAKYLRQTRYDSMDQFTKLQLADFVRRFSLAQDKFYSSFTEQLIKELEAFMKADTEIQKQIAAAVTGKTILEANTPLKKTIDPASYTQLPVALQRDYKRVGDKYWRTEAYDANAQASGIYGVAPVDGSDDATAQLWANITHSPVPATGGLMLKMIDDFGTYMKTQTALLINKGYANAWKVTDFEKTLLGTGDDFTGGLFGSYLLRMQSLLNTVTQHVSSEDQAAVDSVYFEQYQWVAILDNRTTIICRDRNGVVYVYGEGPLPPAHWNCRSKAVPVASGSVLHDIPETYFDWLVTQPSWFLEDVLGHEQANKLIEGESLPGSFAAISTIKPLTLDEFQGKVKYILGAV
jgi:SPP1 gp7 family putative phage head morphogenesis protein